MMKWRRDYRSRALKAAAAATNQSRAFNCRRRPLPDQLRHRQRRPSRRQVADFQHALRCAVFQVVAPLVGLSIILGLFGFQAAQERGEHLGGKSVVTIVALSRPTFSMVFVHYGLSWPWMVPLARHTPAPARLASLCCRAGSPDPAGSLQGWPLGRPLARQVGAGPQLRTAPAAVPSTVPSSLAVRLDLISS